MDQFRQRAIEQTADISGLTAEQVSRAMYLSNMLGRRIGGTVIQCELLLRSAHLLKKEVSDLNRMPCTCQKGVMDNCRCEPCRHERIRALLDDIENDFAVHGGIV